MRFPRSSLFVLITSIVSAFAQSTVQNDISQKIPRQIVTLSNHLKGFPASGFSGALTIHGDALNLANVITATTNDGKSTGFFTEDDDDTIIIQLTAIGSTLVDAVNVFIEKKYNFQALLVPGGAFVLPDLQKFFGSSKAFADALIADASADKVKPLINFRKTIESAFVKALEACSN